VLRKVACHLHTAAEYADVAYDIRILIIIYYFTHYTRHFLIISFLIILNSGTSSCCEGKFEVQIK